MIRFLAILAVVTAWLSVAVPGLAADKLKGRYFGIDEAAGAAFTIAPDAEGYKGTFFDPQGKSQKFLADASGDAAEAVLDMDKRTVLMRIAPLPYGAQVTLVPYGKNGNLLMSASRTLAFLRQGMKLPNMPATFVPAPPAGCKRIASHSFLVSYQFWPPGGVVNGYTCLPERARTLMRMFPAVHLDVIWKLCLARGAKRALAEALRGAGVTCKAVRRIIADAQRRGRFARYKAEVEKERQTFKLSVRCADGYLESKSSCDRAARDLARAAASLRTPAMVLRRYR